MIDALPLRRSITLLALLSLLLLALASRLISGVGVPEPSATAGPRPYAAFGTMIYTGVDDSGLHIWEFGDPSCPGPFRILVLPLSGEGEPLARLLRQPGEEVAYWYGGAIYAQAARARWLFRLPIERLRSPLHAKDGYFYLMIFHPAACDVPLTADWQKLAAAIYQ
jgi:hypothetical protein